MNTVHAKSATGKKAKNAKMNAELTVDNLCGFAGINFAICAPGF